MMKFAILFVALFVSIQAKPFPFLGNYNPYNFDTPDDDQQGGQVNVAGQIDNDGGGDTPDDDQVAAAGGVGVAGQAGQLGTTMAPPASSPEDSSDSSSSSSEEDAESEDAAPSGAPGTTAPAAGPIIGRGAGGTGGGAGAGDSSGNVEAAVGGPIYAEPQGAGAQGGSSNGNDVGAPTLLQMKPQALKEREAKNTGAAVALTTFLLVAGVATISIVAYKYKDAIRARMGL